MIMQGREGRADKWQFGLFTDPDQSLYIIMMACGFILFVIGVAIIVLHASEKKIDKDKMQLPDFWNGSKTRQNNTKVDL